MLTPAFNATRDPQELIRAAERGDADKVRAELDAGTDIDAAPGTMGMTALMWAGQSGSDEVARLLLERGADVNIRDTNCAGTALMWAVEHGRTNIVRMILGKNPNLDVQDTDGDTALMYAARQGYRAIALLLLEKGARTDLRNKEGKTAAEISNSGDAADGLVADVISDFLQKRAEQAARDAQAIQSCHTGVPGVITVRKSPLKLRDIASI